MDKPVTETLMTPSEFTFSITRRAVSQICQNIGFKRTNLSALQTLTHIATLYLQTLAKIAASHAADCNRTNSNLFDVIFAFEDLASVQGFRSAADADGNILRSSTVSDLVKFVDYNDEVPFAKAIPSFGSSRRRAAVINVMRKKKEINGVAPHVPIWLPPFPDRNTYSRETPMIDSLQKCGENVVKDDATREINGENRMVMLPKKRGRIRFQIGETRKGPKKKYNPYEESNPGQVNHPTP